MSDSIEELKSLDGKACIELYLSLHVSQVGDKSEQVKQAWSTGQELYFQPENMRCNHNWIAADNEVIKGGLVCTKCMNVKAI